MKNQLKKFSLKITAHKYLWLLSQGLTSQDIAILLQEIKKLKNKD